MGETSEGKTWRAPGKPPVEFSENSISDQYLPVSSREHVIEISAGPRLGGATRLRGSALSPKSSASALSPKLML